MTLNIRARMFTSLVAVVGISILTMAAQNITFAQQHERGVNHHVHARINSAHKIANPLAQGYHLTFQSEFKGKSLNRKKWITSYPDNQRTHSNNEQEYYADKNVVESGGMLSLVATDRPMDGMKYTSGMIASYGHFSQEYGLFEIRAKFPAGKGYWPAFWLLPENKSWPPEIDILEILGNQPDKVYLTNHYGQNGQPAGKGGFYVGPDFSTGFHTFSLKWTPTQLIWYVDGVARYQTTENIPHVPMYVIANLAVGGDWPGMPDQSTVFPGKMQIKWIRVYKK